MVGPPGALSSSKRPPSIRTRSLIPISPSRPRFGGRREALLDGEALAVVDDAKLGPGAAAAEPDVDGGRLGVLAHVREALLDGPEEGHALRGGEERVVPLDDESREDAVRCVNVSTSRCRTSSIGLLTALRDSSEWASSRSSWSSSTSRFEQIGRSGGGRVTVELGGEEGYDVVAQAPQIGGGRQDVLDRPVVEVEAEPHQPPLAAGDERALALGAAIEQVGALEQGGEGARGLRQERAGRDAHLRGDLSTRTPSGLPQRGPVIERISERREASTDRGARASASFAARRIRREGSSSPSETMQSSWPG